MGHGDGCDPLLTVTMRALERWPRIGFLASLVGCVTIPSEIVVRIDTDMDPASELAEVDLDVRRQGESTPAYRIAYQLGTEGFRRLPGEVGFKAESDDDVRPLVVRVTATLAGTPTRTLTRDFTVRFAPERRLVLDVFLPRACAPGAPPGVAACGEGESCGRNGCEPGDRATLPELRSDVVAIAAGGDRTCARRANGTVLCWGENVSGGVGDGTTTDRAVPTGISGLTDVHQLELGKAHGCARLSTGGVWCWGANEYRQSSDGASTAVLSPTPMNALPRALGVAAGTGHSCARIGDAGGVWCWGRNDQGQLGDGRTMAQTAPAVVIGTSALDLVEIAAGGDHTCALGRNGRVHCWGANTAGERGVVTELVDAVGIAAGARHTCALRASGSVVCWGSNQYGQLGDTTAVNRNLPTAVAELTDAVEVVAGDEHTCARRANGAVVCWGRGIRGQLGDGTMTNREALVAVAGLEGAVEVAAGGQHTCARLATGVVRCWGANDHGQLGVGVLGDRAQASVVGGL